MIDDFMLCLVSDDNLYQGKILVNVHKDEKSITKNTFSWCAVSAVAIKYEWWLWPELLQFATYVEDLQQLHRVYLANYTK